MRVFTGGRGAHPSATGAMHLWTFDQDADTDAVHDLIDTADGGQVLTSTGDPTSLVASPISKCREFDGSTQYAAGTADGADAGLGIEFALLHWARPDPAFAAQGFVVAYGGNGNLKKDNFLVSSAVNANGTLQMYWEHGDGVPDISTSTATVPFGEWSHVAWVFSETTLWLYINGTLAQTFTGLTAPEYDVSGNTQRWVIGAAADSLASKFKGRIASVAFYDGTLSASVIAESFRRGMGWSAYGAQMHTRVRATDGDGNLTDVSTLAGRDWLESVELHDDVDAKGIAGTVRLWRETSGGTGAASLAKLVDNKLNRTPSTGIGPDDTTFTAGTTEFLALGRAIKVDVARVPWGIPRSSIASAEWQEVLDGVIDDVDWSADPITVKVQDIVTQRLQMAYLEAEATYSDAGGTAVETIMQEILNDASATSGSGWYAGDAVSLYTPTSPSWNITTFRQRREPVLQALCTLAEQIGWTVRRRWDPGTGAFRLTFEDVERTRTQPHGVLGPDDYSDVTRAQLALAGIRNVVRVCYPSSETTTPSSGVSVPSGYTRTSGWAGGINTMGAPAHGSWVQWVNTASVTKYGRQFMEDAEASASNIDKVTEADRYALGMLRDLMEPTIDQGARCFAFPEIETGDLLRWEANGRHYTSDQTLGVVGWALNLANDKCSSDIQSRGAPSGGSIIHRAKESRGGNALPPVLSASELTTGKTWGQRRTMVSDLIYGTHLVRAGRGTTITNPDFSDRITVGNGPPEGWTATGTWGTDVDVDATNALSGSLAIDLKTATGKLTSSVFAVRGSQTVQCEMTWKASASEDASLVVEWFQADRVTAASTASNTAFTDTTGTTWITSRANVTAPSNARWAKVRIERAAGADHVYVDRVNCVPMLPTFRAYLDTTPQPVNDKADNVVVFNTESHDIGGGFATGTGKYTVPESGLYRFHASVAVDPDTAGAAAYGVASIWVDTGGGAALAVAGPDAFKRLVAYALATVDSGEMFLNMGDVVEVHVWPDDQSGSPSPTLAIGSALTWFSGALVPQE